MTSITKAKEEDFQVLAEIGKQSFIESHGSSASLVDIKTYTDEKFNDDVLKQELCCPENIYHIIYYDKRPAGYSKIIFNGMHPNIEIKNVAKLERLYLLKDFYSLKLGYELLKFNIEVSQMNGQAGMWLFVWKENQRAVNFYLKTGFQIIGSHDFQLTVSHVNPNYQLFLRY